MSALHRSRKLLYKEGDWFAVPLRSGGFALGVIARESTTASPFGYFFGPRIDRVPTLNEVKNLRSKDAVLLQRFGDLGLINGKWPIIGALPFKRVDWPMPQFVRGDIESSATYLVEYDDRDAGSEVAIRRAAMGECIGLPEDGLFGYGAIEIRLTNILAKSPEKQAPALRSIDRRNTFTKSGSTAEPAPPKKEEEAVLIYLGARYQRGATFSPKALADLEEDLTTVITNSGVGEFDGDEVGANEAVLYMYGPDARELFATIENTLRFNPICQGARVVIRKGGPGSPVQEVRI